MDDSSVNPDVPDSGRHGYPQWGSPGQAGLARPRGVGSTSSTEEARCVMADVTRTQRARRDLAVQDKDNMFVEQNAEEIG